MNIKFHCSEKSNFPNENQKIRAFLYKDYSIESHNHDFYEINIVMHGTAVHNIEDNAFGVQTGDIFVIPPMTVHSYYNTQNLDVFHILLKKEFISSNMKEAMNVDGFIQLFEIEPYLRSHFEDKMFLHYSRSQLNSLQTDLNIIDENTKYDFNRPEVLKEHTTWKIIYMFAGALYEHINSSKKIKSHKYEQSIIFILEYMHKNYSEKITLDTLCKKTYLSRSTLLRNFYDICGCMPIEYLNNYRCKCAVEMLENHPELSKTQIAHNCGFYDLSHMNRMLKTNQKF